MFDMGVGTAFIAIASRSFEHMREMEERKGFVWMLWKLEQLYFFVN